MATVGKTCKCGVSMLPGPSGWLCPSCGRKVVPYEEGERKRIPSDAQIIGPNDPTPVCDECNGSREVTCPDCSGNGDDTCFECGSPIECDECGGAGMVECVECTGCLEE